MAPEFALEAKLTFDRVIESFTDGGADEHLYPRDRRAVFGIPVLPIAGRNLDQGNAWIVFAFGEPGLNNRFPELFDLFFVARDTGRSVQDEEVGMRGTLKVESDFRVKRDFLILMAIVGAIRWGCCWLIEFIPE